MNDQPGTGKTILDGESDSGFTGWPDLALGFDISIQCSALDDTESTPTLKEWSRSMGWVTSQDIGFAPAAVMKVDPSTSLFQESRCFMLLLRNEVRLFVYC